jgi:hypothetical protein
MRKTLKVGGHLFSFGVACSLAISLFTVPCTTFCKCADQYAAEMELEAELGMDMDMDMEMENIVPGAPPPSLAEPRSSKCCAFHRIHHSASLSVTCRIKA